MPSANTIAVGSKTRKTIFLNAKCLHLGNQISTFTDPTLFAMLHFFSKKKFQNFSRLFSNFFFRIFSRLFFKFFFQKNRMDFSSSSPADATLNALIYCFGCDIGRIIYSFCEPTWVLELEGEIIAGLAPGALHYKSDFVRCQHVYLRFAADNMELDFFFTENSRYELKLHDICVRLGDRTWYSNAYDTFRVGIGKTFVWALCGECSYRFRWAPNDCIQSLQRATGFVVSK